MDKNKNYPHITTQHDSYKDDISHIEGCELTTDISGILYDLEEYVKISSDRFCNNVGISYSVITSQPIPEGGYAKIKVGNHARYILLDIVYIVHLNVNMSSGDVCMFIGASENYIEVIGVAASMFADLLREEIKLSKSPLADAKISYVNLSPDGKEYDRFDGERFYRK